MRGVKEFGAALVLAGIVFGLQLRSGAYHADFDSTADEPGHVVSSLMVRDYLASGNLLHPWEFATNYYIHYPKVAILHWPPLFHLCEALWMFAGGRSRIGLLSLQGSIGAALALSVFFWLQRDYGFWIAFISAIVLAATRLLQTAAAAVAPDLLLGALVFWAVTQYARYLTTGLSRYAWWSAALGLAALGVHGRAAALFMVPIVAMLFLRITAPRVIAAILVILVYTFVPSFLGYSYPTSALGILENSGKYLMSLGAGLTWPVFILALIGIAAGFRFRQRNYSMTVMIALVLSCWIFHSIVKVPPADYFLITSVPAMIVLAAGGASLLWRSLPAGSHWSQLAAMSLAALSLSIAGLNILRSPVKENLGARRLLTDDTLYFDRQKIWLVAGSSVFEGAVIAETALRDRAKDHIVLRASKMLAHSTWSGAGYRLLFLEQSSVSAFLDRTHVGWVVVQDSESNSIPHVGQLEATLRGSTPVWRTVSFSGPLPDVTLFNRIVPLPGSPIIEIDMRDKFGSFFRLHE